MNTAISWAPRRAAPGVVVVAFAALLFSVELLVGNLNMGGEWDRVATIGMIAPAAFAFRAPLTAAGVQCAATLFNGVVIGPLVRCGTGLPAAFCVAYAVGRHSTGGRRVAGIVLTLTGVAVECYYDPQLGVWAFAMMGPVTVLFFGSGLFLRGRAALVARLRDRNCQLRAQRERTAALSVSTDRLRIRADFDEALRQRMRRIAEIADAARFASGIPTAAVAEIEAAGRATLERMRDIVGVMRSAPSGPEPGLATLAELFRTATTADVRLVVGGLVRPLPSSVELSGYRIVEHLLPALADDPAAAVQVRVTFGPDVLEIKVAGPPAADPGPANAVIVARERARLHGGTVRVGLPTGRWEAWVRLPLVPGRV